ncbi:HAMP domain-containing histidine kinase [Thalassotalea sp. HSM 43]|uniref:sensor histidine kinase n=1 Tax=Thalassotalea sp. HSM 43 TaxID=2552945 RepID=UPI00108157A4|nr:HAMP domain-containing sensor histidine kinase [Thalassotalea sp. HSM 43]QBY02926.1 HAMP domain-containing histidine kinase [Thalassotalea sp. HSM 43]
MKTQFIKLFLLIFSTLLILAVVSEKLFSESDDEYYSDINAVHMFNSLEIIDTQSAIVKNVRVISVAQLSWPAELLVALENGEIVPLHEKNNNIYFYKLNPNEPTSVIQLGPFNIEQPESSFSALPVIFYSSFALLLFAWIWPMFRDLERLNKATESFSKYRKLIKVDIKTSSRVHPVAQSLSEMSAKVLHYMSLQQFLASTVSHDIRTPVSRINFCVDMLDTNNLEQSKQSIFEDLDEIELLTHNFIEFSKLEGQIANLDIKQQNLVIVIKRLVEKLLANSKIAIELHAPETILVKFDQEFLRRALQNIIVNALKYAKSTVRVSLKCYQSSVQIIIEDDGVGIKEEERERVIYAYQRGTDETDISKGYGLGLALTSVISQWHNGELRISRSETLTGTKVVFLLPR